MLKYTQIPNILLGDINPGNIVSPGLMAELTGSQLKVLLAVCRITLGYQQSERRASLKMLMEFTGLSKPGVHNAAKHLETLELIERKQDGGVTLWKVGVKLFNHSLCQAEVKKVNQVVKKVNQGGKIILPPSKKETKKKLKKNNNDVGTSLLLPDTPESKLLFERLGIEFHAKGRRAPKRFPSLACKEKFDRTVIRLDGNIAPAIQRAFEKGIMSITQMVDFIAKWQGKGYTKDAQTKGKYGSRKGILAGPKKR